MRRRSLSPFFARLRTHTCAPTRIGLGVAAVYIKDESERLDLPSFKILGASWAVERLLRESPDVAMLVAASAGNHGRAVAHVAAMRDLDCRVYLPKRSIAERRAAIANEGAEVIIVDGSYEDAVRSAERAAKEDGVALIADVGDGRTANWVIDGLRNTVQRAEGPGGLQPPSGSGRGWFARRRGRAARRASRRARRRRRTRHRRLPRRIAGGQDTDNRSTPGTTMAGLDCSDVSRAAWPTLCRGIAGSVTVTDEEAEKAMLELAASGLAIGESGASTLAGLRALLTDRRCDALRERIGIGGRTKVLLVGSEGRTGDPAAAA